VIAWQRSDDRRRLAKGGFEGFAVAGADIEDGHFKDH
jgi:hypothetical protein